LHTLDSRVKKLLQNFPKLINSFSYRKGPSLYFYKKTIQSRREKPLETLFEESDRFIELIYATLVAWDMNSRGAKMKYFDDFKLEILKNKKSFQFISDYALDKISYAKLLEIKRISGTIYDNLHVMRSGGKLVSNSKLMHFILPDLIMPMDRQNTLRFFFKHSGESKSKFLTILEYSYHLAKALDIRIFIDDNWNQSVPKIIDNAIICHMTPKYSEKT